MQEIANRRSLWPFSGNAGAQILKIGSGLDYSNRLFAVILLALHSIFWPYRGIVHDARFYGLQALNKAKDGQFAHDLFFAFGSQDKYSAFSSVLSPAVSWMGLDLAFWLAYMAASALFLYSAVRLFRALVPDSSLANIAPLALMAIPILYGGIGAFRVQENFFTARLVAQGFGLLAIAAVYRKRPYQAMSLALAGIAFHPIMGLSPFLAILAVFLKDRLDKTIAIRTVFLLGIAALLLVAFIQWDSIRPWIARDEWRYALVKRRTYTSFPLQWYFIDWYRMLASIAVLWWSCSWLAPRAKALIHIVVWTGVAGVAASVAGEWLACPILIQGQGYRAFWLVQALALPLGLLTVCRLSIKFSNWGSWTALGLFIFLCNPFFVGADRDYLAISVYQTGAFLLVFAFVGFKKNVNHRKRLLSVLRCLPIMAAGLSAALAGAAIHAKANYGTEMADIAQSMIKLSSRTFVFMIALFILSAALSIIKTPRSVAAFSLAVWLSTSLVTFMLKERPEYKERIRPGYKDVQFIGETIEKNLHKSDKYMKDEQIYWTDCAEWIWFSLQANSYYSHSQLVGVIFNKGTILEGTRRAALAKPFEVAKLKKIKTPLREGERMELSFLNATMQDPPPAEKDLFRLANDSMLDWIILDIGFEGLYSATNQSVYIYDCSMLRRMGAVRN